MNLGTRKLPGSGEAPREGFSGNPRIIAGAIFDANCKLQGSATVSLRKLNLSRR